METVTGQKVLSSLKPVLFICKLCGILYIGPKPPLRTYLAYRCMILTLYLCCLVHEIPTMKFWVKNVSYLHSILALAEVILRWSILLINFIVNIVYNVKINKTLDQLFSLGINLPLSSTNWIYRFQIGHLMWNALICATFQAIGNLLVWENTNFRWYTAIIYVITEFNIGLTLFLYVELVIMIREFFKELNKKLTSVGRSLHLPLDSEDILSVYKDSRRGVVAIIHIRDYHLKLCAISKDFSSCFAIQLLFLVTLAVVEVTYSLRSLVFYVARSSDHGWWENQPLFEFLLTLFWLVYSFGGLVQIVASSDITAAESTRASCIIHELINNRIGDHMQKELLIFSQQLEHHSATFTAGIFSLRYSLISSITGAIITYLIIIVTFKE